MSSYILCIFEGQKTEPNIARSLCKFFLNDHEKTVVLSSYGHNIYQLFKEVHSDKFVNLYDILLEKISNRDPHLNDHELVSIDDPEKISDIYLFFDYDCHCTNADDDKLSEMLKVFNDPQEQGLLFVSYPMVEAIRHQFKTPSKEVLFPKSEISQYKRWITNNKDIEEKFINWKNYDSDIWKSIITEHLVRANYLTTDDESYPKSQFNQTDIFQNQLRKHLPENIAVISSFPLMLFNYYGKRLKEDYLNL